MKNSIRLNCDMGEGINNEIHLMPYLHACSIACGGHAGTKELMNSVADMAIKEKVFIGAHPSYPDKKYFGRKSMKLSKSALTDTVQGQIERLQAVLQSKDILLHHIKPHGALYNDIAKDEEQANDFLDAVEPYKDTAILFVPPRSIIFGKAIERNFQIQSEAFADRRYNKDGSLVSRNSKNALINEPKKALQQVQNIIQHQTVQTITGELIPLKADTFCIHSDTRAALNIAKLLFEHSL